MTKNDWAAVMSAWDRVDYVFERDAVSAASYAADAAIIDAVRTVGVGSSAASVVEAVRIKRGSSAALRAAEGFARDDARDALRCVEKAAKKHAEKHAAGELAYYAALEILGADLLRERGQPFFFLPMFGFADEQAIIKQEST
jgi:hypothetical protein